MFKPRTSAFRRLTKYEIWLFVVDIRFWRTKYIQQLVIAEMYFYIDAKNNLVISITSYFKPTIIDRVAFVEEYLKPFILK